MNPFALLLGLLGVGAIGGLGSVKKDLDIKNPKSVKDLPEDTTPTRDPETTEDEPADPVPQEPPAPQEPPIAQEPTTPQEPTGTPQAPTQTGDGGGNGGETIHFPAEGTVDVMAGRVATLSSPADDIDGIRIVSGLNHGTVTVNPDNSFAVVMTLSDFTGAQGFTYEATHADGTITLHDVALNVTPGLQEGGWGTGSTHYMLETDENDKVIVETGDNHTKVFISGSDSALTLAKIAVLEGVSVQNVTGSFLASHGYGQSEDLALAQDAGMALWHEVTPAFSESSNWLLLERGYEYGELGRFLDRGADGEDPLHPLYIGAWGEGDRPEITDEFFQYQDSTSNLVVQDIHFSGRVFLLNAENIIFDNVKITDDSAAIQKSDGITIRNSEIIDNYSDSPSNGTDWQPHADRSAGLYMNYNDGVLLEGNFFDHNGWGEGYLTGDGQPPSMFSHNLYLDADMSDVTLRDTITMRGASFGAQVRSGGFIEDNLFLDNNAGLTFVGGDYEGAGPVGEYTLASDNLITSGAHKTGDMIGALTMGLINGGEMTSLVDNIITHLADPNNPDEQAAKIWTHDALRHDLAAYYDDTIVWNWDGVKEEWFAPDQNVDGLDTAVLDQTTIQIFTQQLLGDPNATIADLADYIRAHGDGAFDNVVDADLIIRFFQEGFGIAPDIRDTEETLRFVPDDLGDGVRWDNKLNWSTDDLPGTQDGDSVDLGGNHVVYGGNTKIDTLDFGPGGKLEFYNGKLTVTGGLVSDTEGHIGIHSVGQLWTEGSSGSGSIDIDVDGGRFANTGTMGNVDLTASGGQVILATGGAEYDVDAGFGLTIHDNAKVGFDGAGGGTAILDLHEGSKLSFLADSDGLGEISEFRSGAFGDGPDVQSGIDLGNAALEIDLTGLTAAAGTAFTLMSADEIVGLFDQAVVGGLGARDATITIDYQSDTVTLGLAAGSGAVSIKTVGQQADVDAGHEDLWATLTADHGLMEDTAAAMVPDEEDLLDAAA